MFERLFKGISRVFSIMVSIIPYGCLKEASYVFPGFSQVGLRAVNVYFKGCLYFRSDSFMGVSKGFHKCLNGLSLVFQWSYMHVSMVI